MAVQLQWSLDKSTSTVYSITRGVLMAANQDNVQPLAIAASEKFGNTIAMCEETCSKIQALTGHTTAPIIINFLKAYVGFDPSDSATQLSKSQAGVQFLGLAAALITSMGPDSASKCLYSMLSETASDKTLSPTARQLRDLLSALEPRLVHSGFLDSVVGWKLFFTGRDSGQIAPALRTVEDVATFTDSYPSADAIHALINSFRALCRVGSADIDRIVIETASNIPWIVAFTKWCLGVPPSIYSRHDEEPLIEQEGTKVHLVLGVSDSQAIKISIVESIGSLHTIVETSSGKPSVGLVTAERLGQATLASMRCDRGTGLRVMQEGIPIALSALVKYFHFAVHPIPDSLDHEVTAWKTIPLPDDYLIARAAGCYLGTDQNAQLPSVKGNLSWDDIPTVEAYRRDLKKSCECTECQTETEGPGPECVASNFLRCFALVCADILALSLFMHFEVPLLFLRPQRERDVGSGLVFLISTFFNHRDARPHSEISGLLYHALDLVGHNTPEYTETWISSGFKGQVVFPTIFETYRYGKRGFLSLSCIPGNLQYKDEVFTQVLSSSRTYRLPIMEDFAPGKGSYSAPVDRPRMLTGSSKLNWEIQVEYHDFRIQLSIKDKESSLPKGQFYLDRIWYTLSTALIVEACKHDQSSVLSTSDDSCVYTTPVYPKLPDSHGSDTPHIGVVATDGCHEMRFLALANSETAVLRKHACLSCCLEICRKFSYSVLIL